MSFLANNALSKLWDVIFHQDFSPEAARRLAKKLEKMFPIFISPKNVSHINPPKLFPILNPILFPICIPISYSNLLKYTHFSRKSPKIVIIMKFPINSL